MSSEVGLTGSTLGSPAGGGSAGPFVNRAPEAPVRTVEPALPARAELRP